MKLIGAAVCIASLLLLASFGGPARAQSEDVFSFIPPGGKTLLIDIINSDAPADEVRSLLTGDRDRAGWVAYLRERREAVGALQKLDEVALKTLASYLSFHMPLSADQVPQDMAGADWQEMLPPDGRRLTLDNCQFCHIITVVVTQDRPVEHWLNTLNKPSHVEIEISDSQREEMVRYLVLNGGIPAEEVPEELRAGGASY